MTLLMAFRQPLSIKDAMLETKSVSVPNISECGTVIKFVRLFMHESSGKSRRQLLL